MREAPDVWEHCWERVTQVASSAWPKDVRCHFRNRSTASDPESRSISMFVLTRWHIDTNFPDFIVCPLACSNPSTKADAQCVYPSRDKRDRRRIYRYETTAVAARQHLGRLEEPVRNRRLPRPLGCAFAHRPTVTLHPCATGCGRGMSR